MVIATAVLLLLPRMSRHSGSDVNFLSFNLIYDFLSTGTQDGGTVITRTIMMGGAEPTRTETIRQTTMPTEIIQKTITIEGDGNQLTAEELKDIIAKHAGDIGSSEVVTTVSRDYAMAIMLMENESNKVRKPRKK